MWDYQHAWGSLQSAYVCSLTDQRDSGSRWLHVDARCCFNMLRSCAFLSLTEPSWESLGAQAVSKSLEAAVDEPSTWPGQTSSRALAES